MNYIINGVVLHIVAVMIHACTSCPVAWHPTHPRFCRWGCVPSYSPSPLLAGSHGACLTLTSAGLRVVPLAFTLHCQDRTMPPSPSLLSARLLIICPAHPSPLLKYHLDATHPRPVSHSPRLPGLCITSIKGAW